MYPGHWAASRRDCPAHWAESEHVRTPGHRRLVSHLPVRLPQVSLLPELCLEQLALSVRASSEPWVPRRASRRRVPQAWPSRRSRPVFRRALDVEAELLQGDALVVPRRDAILPAEPQQEPLASRARRVQSCPRP